MEKLITLCMIVRNEEKCLEETVQSFLDDFDQSVIVDTGSTDETPQRAQDWTDQGRALSFEWCDDFSAARNYALEQCAEDTDWILMPDADFKLLPEHRGQIREAINAADDDVAAIWPALVCGASKFMLNCVVFRRTKCHFEGPTHNVLVIDEGTIVKRPDIIIEHDQGRRGEENRAERHAQRCKMNKRNLKKQTRENPENGRAWFYLGSTVQEEPAPQRAIAHFLRCLEVDKWGEERYEARRRLAQCYMATDQLPLAVEQLLLAHGEDGRRAECAFWLGELYTNGRAYERARMWYNVAANCPLPAESGVTLFTDTRCYGDGPLAKLAALDGLAEGGSANTEQEWDERYKQGYSLSARHKALLREIVRHVDDFAPDALLDVGAGTGLLLDMLAVETAVGIDFSKEAAARHAQIIHDHATSLATQEDDVYDVVTCVSLLEHVDSPLAVLEQIERVVKPGGKVIISVPRAGEMDCAEHVREYTSDDIGDELSRFGGAVSVDEFEAWWIAQATV